MRAGGSEKVRKRERKDGEKEGNGLSGVPALFPYPHPSRAPRHPGLEREGGREREGGKEGGWESEIDREGGGGWGKRGIYRERDIERGRHCAPRRAPRASSAPPPPFNVLGGRDRGHDGGRDGVCTRKRPSKRPPQRPQQVLRVVTHAPQGPLSPEAGLSVPRRACLSRGGPPLSR